MNKPLLEKTNRPSSPMQFVAWPVLGMVVLVLANVVGDLLRNPSPGIFGRGAFLHIAWVDGAPVGACIDILNHASKIVILAIGMAIVVATRGVDLSVGSIMAIAGATAASLTVSGTPAIGAIGISMLAAIICGVFNGVMVTTLRLQPFVATLVLMVAGRGIAQMITDGQVITFHDPLLTYIGNGRPPWLPLPMPVLIAAALLAVTILITRRTAVGMMIAVVGSNPQAARLSGVRSGLFIAGAYVFSGFCAGVAGLIAASNIKAADPHHAGLTLELSAIFAVVIGGGSLGGGRFSLAGAAMGAMLVQTLTATMYARNVMADVAPLPVAVMILLVCVLGSPMLREWWWSKRRKAAAA